MSAAPLPDAEFERLLALARYEVLDTVPEDRFDTLTDLAAQVLEVPFAFINFIDQYRYWSKSCVGLPENSGPRDLAFCAWTILHDQPLLIPDLQLDARFTGHPMVTGAPHLLSYAGAPIVTPDGHAIGTVCVLDTQVRHWTERHAQLLTRLAALTLDALTLSVREQELQREVQARAVQVQDLKRTARHAETLAAVTNLFDSGISASEALHASAQLLSDALHLDWAGLLEQDGARLLLTASWDRRGGAAPLISDPDLSAYQGGVSGLSVQMQRSAYIDHYPSHPKALAPFVEAGVTAVATLALGEHQGARSVLLAVQMHQEGRWRQSDRALLEAAGRSVRAALERADQLRHAQTAAFTDSLTGLGNRRAFDQHLAALDSTAAPFTAVVLDLDGMKAVNDVEGHERGDVLLRLFAQALRAQFRTHDALFRLGGDEFAVLLKGAGGLTEDEVLERTDLAVVAVRASGFARVGVSVGVASGAERPADVVRTADERMYDRKRRRKVHLAHR